MPFFSIIIPSRNRPQILAAAVQSILDQDYQDYEILVVDDGSTPTLTLEQIFPEAPLIPQLRIVNLGFQPRGRGPGYARNVGVWSATGEYCVFLDDDDIWIKNDHLSWAYKALTTASTPAAVYLANQEALTGPGAAPRLLWLYPMVQRLDQDGRTKSNGCYRVSADELIACGGFSHLNTTIVSRQLFDRIGGIDEYLAYEEDLDFYLRCIDVAEEILFCPDIVARHHVPDKTRQANASTAVTSLNRLNIRLFLLNKNIINARHDSIVQYCARYAADTTKLIASHYLDQGRYLEASKWAQKAATAPWSLKWGAYSLYLRSRALIHGDKASAS